MPIEYLPVIGSLNQELNEHATLQGKTIPTPNEAMRIVEGYIEPSGMSATDTYTQSSTETEDTHSEEDIVYSYDTLGDISRYCRRCGVKLQPDSEYCHKCGTRILR